MTQERNDGSLTRFGALVLSFAMECGVTKQKELAAMVTELAPEEVNQRRLSSWLRGEHEPPWWFCEVLVDVLDLSEEQMGRLAWANTYFQKTSVKQAS